MLIVGRCGGLPDGAILRRTIVGSRHLVAILSTAGCLVSVILQFQAVTSLAQDLAHGDVHVQLVEQ